MLGRCTYICTLDGLYEENHLEVAQATVALATVASVDRLCATFNGFPDKEAEAL